MNTVLEILVKKRRHFVLYWNVYELIKNGINYESVTDP
jgi:hypothetical protein